MKSTCRRCEFLSLGFLPSITRQTCQEFYSLSPLKPNLYSTKLFISRSRLGDILPCTFYLVLYLLITTPLIARTKKLLFSSQWPLSTLVSRKRQSIESHYNVQYVTLYKCRNTFVCLPFSASFTLMKYRKCLLF